ncbi:MAG: hypothetical protein ACXVKO_15060 [Bacteriovorax sp.]
MVVVRPGSLVIIDVEIEFNFLNYLKIEIDLQHINRGKNLTRETNLSEEEILILVKEFLNGEILESEVQKDYGDEI